MTIKRYKADHLSDTQLECIELLLYKDIVGMTHEEIAEQLGINAKTIYMWKREELFQKKLTERAVEEMDTLAPDLFIWMQKVMSPTSKYKESTQVKTAELIMKKLGILKQVSEVETTATIMDNRKQTVEELMKSYGIKRD
ncbi:phBC6A51 family helix-turn-helix protein [Candidatus Enterococcus clewellii]|uniref:Homeodomain phBC6A51-type domain-containing protein n=1 Tax=Candidatus Enterococcus clewellii TaxID=1834193 RepID=A0A242KD74_9ENTE|nr:phBC6A51 family helix-turn-helix protein [Enterococcus sp. 9E7_DIV0242]OTP18738.1 hypothetical protein A5888_000552 [Enterococcus sp. 9E7_DIV0242]